jgi:hypothetical protein
MFFLKSYRIRRLKRWLRVYEWRYFDLADWARQHHSEEQWAEKINSHRRLLRTMKVPWSLEKLEEFD